MRVKTIAFFRLYGYCVTYRLTHIIHSNLYYERRIWWKKITKSGQRTIQKLSETINHFFPDLFERMRQIEDHRKKKKYDIAAIITACICMFLFKEGSRNAYNNDRNEGLFKKNYKRIFKMKSPHPDTVDAVMRVLKPEELELLKKRMVNILHRKKVFNKYRLFSKYVVIAVDATGVFKFDHEHCPNCCHKTSKNGKITYFHNVLEAKLICANGFSISIATEWIENPSGEYNKQDCENKAFSRLSERLKKLYPRLPICIAADGLYPNQTFFGICQKNDWQFILTFKDGNLPSVWDEVNTLRKMSPGNVYTSVPIMQGNVKIQDNYSWVNDIPYWSHSLNWIQCLETKENLKSNKSETTRFVHIRDFTENKLPVFRL